MQKTEWRSRGRPWGKKIHGLGKKRGSAKKKKKNQTKKTRGVATKPRNKNQPSEGSNTNTLSKQNWTGNSRKEKSGGRILVLMV